MVFAVASAVADSAGCFTGHSSSLDTSWEAESFGVGKAAAVQMKKFPPQKMVFVCLSFFTPNKNTELICIPSFFAVYCLVKEPQPFMNIRCNNVDFCPIILFLKGETTLIFEYLDLCCPLSERSDSKPLVGKACFAASQEQTTTAPALLASLGSGNWFLGSQGMSQEMALAVTLPAKLPRKSWEVGKMTFNFKGSQYLGDLPPMDFQLNHELSEEEFRFVDSVWRDGCQASFLKKTCTPVSEILLSKMDCMRPLPNSVPQGKCLTDLDDS